MTGFRGAASKWGPCVLTGAMLAVNAAFSAEHIAVDWHGLVDVITGAAVVWAIGDALGRKYGGPKLRDGDRIVSEGDYLKMEQALARGIAEGLGARAGDRRMKLHKAVNQ